MEQRPLTQDELLAEAARTELDNVRDLEQMVALEEATRQKAMYKRSKYSGPMIRFHSKKVNDVALVSRACCCRHLYDCFRSHSHCQCVAFIRATHEGVRC